MFNVFNLLITCIYTSFSPKKVFSLLSLFIISFMGFTSYAQEFSSQINVTAFTNKNASLQGFPAGSLVLMADGNEKKIEDIQIGELVASYDPVLDDYIVSSVTQVQAAALEESMASVMLILDDISVSLQTHGNLAGVSLLVMPATEVLTKKGPTQIQNLTENDVLYCYDAAAHRFLRFRMYDSKISRRVAPQTIYRIDTEEKNCIINSTVFLQNEDL